MNKYLFILFICIAGTGFSVLTSTDPNHPITIPPSAQRTGNVDSGYQYIIYGDYVNSGLPLLFYRMGMGRNEKNLLQREGINASVRYDFNVMNAPNGETIVVPNCLQCHAQ